MKRYVLNIYQPVGEPPSKEFLEPILADVTRVAADMKAAGAWVFSAGLHPTATATVVRVRNGETLMTDGPFVEGKEHIGGLTVIDAADLDAALEWARRLSKATTLPVEVRPAVDQAKHP